MLERKGEKMERFLKKTGWTSVITSIVFAIIGIILITNPDSIVKIVSYILGGIFIVIGIIKIIGYFSSKGSSDFYNYNLIYGTIAIVLGIITMIYSSAIGTMFRIMIGIWIIYSGLIRLGFALKLRKGQISSWIAVLVLAMCMLVFGMYIVFNTNAVMVTIGIVILAYAISDLIESLIFVRNIDKVF